MFDRRTALEPRQHRLEKRAGNSEHQNRKHKRKRKRLHHPIPDCLILLPTMTLRDHACCRHAQKAEAPEQKIKNNRGQRHAAKKARIREMTDHRGIHHPQQRHRDIGQHHRQRQRKQTLIEFHGVGALPTRAAGVG